MKKYLYFPILLPSLNKWNTMHYMVKNKLKDDAKNKIELILESEKLEKFNKVKLSFQTFLGNEGFNDITGKKIRNQTSRDIINNSPTIKLIEDCIVTKGYIKDDNAKNVISHIIYSNVIDREFKGSGILLLIEEVDNTEEDLKKYFNEHIKINNIYKNKVKK